MQVRTDKGLVACTWEQAILEQGLAEQSVDDGCPYKAKGMCVSHAVISALEYCHQRTDLLASFLHKSVLGSYEGGIGLEKAMKFAQEKGVMALPPGQKVKHGSGLPWPSGERYKFADVLNADDTFICSKTDQKDSKSKRYKEILSMQSSYRYRCAFWL